MTFFKSPPSARVEFDFNISRHGFDVNVREARGDVGPHARLDARDQPRANRLPDLRLPGQIDEHCDVAGLDRRLEALDGRRALFRGLAPRLVQPLFEDGAAARAL